MTVTGMARGDGRVSKRSELIELITGYSGASFDPFDSNSKLRSVMPAIVVKIEH